MPSTSPPACADASTKGRASPLIRLKTTTAVHTGPSERLSCASRRSHTRQPRTQAHPRRANPPPEAPSDWATPTQEEAREPATPAEHEHSPPAKAADPRLQDLANHPQTAGIEGQVPKARVQEDTGQPTPLLTALNEHLVLAAHGDAKAARTVVDQRSDQVVLVPETGGDMHHHEHADQQPRGLDRCTPADLELRRGGQTHAARR